MVVKRVVIFGMVVMMMVAGKDDGGKQDPQPVVWVAQRGRLLCSH